MKPRRIHLRIESDLNNVALVGTAVQQLCALVSMSEIDAYQVQLAIVEAVNNIIKHAYGHAPGNMVEVGISLYPNRLVFELADRGKPLPELAQPTLDFDPDNLDSVPEGGMGMFIIHSVMDEVSCKTENGQNVQTFVKNLATRHTS